MSDRPLVIYHGGCWDGFCAAWVARRALGADCDFVPINYSENAPDVTGRVVYILDFSFPRKLTLGMAFLAKRLFILDHHKTAQKELEGISLVHGHPDEGTNIFRKFDMTKSGGRLTWEHFFPGKTSPWLVDYTEDRDLWTWRLPESRAVNAALRSYPLDFDTWDFIAQDMASEFIVPGRAILRREKQIVDSHVGFAREVELDGHKVLSVNATVMTSEIAGELAKDRPFGVCWFERKDGRRIFSLRSREGGVDVSEVAKKFGGGGHPAAAGYEV